MSWYADLDGDVRDIDAALMAAWAAAGNPKAQGWRPIPARPSESHNWNGWAWEPPAPAPPATVSARQIRLWLVQRRGIPLAAVEAAIDALPDAATRESVRVEWEYSGLVERGHPMLGPLAATLGLSAADIDQAFLEASRL